MNSLWRWRYKKLNAGTGCYKNLVVSIYAFQETNVKIYLVSKKDEIVSANKQIKKINWPRGLKLLSYLCQRAK